MSICNVPQYAEIRKGLIDKWPLRSDLNPRTLREDAMLEVVAGQLDELMQWVESELRVRGDDTP